jgi:hypothetical protein
MLKRLYELKDPLLEICVKGAFRDFLQHQSKATGENGKTVANHVQDKAFWADIKLLLDILGPLVNALRLADSDVPCAGKIYMQMYNTEQELRSILDDPKFSGFLTKKDIREVRLHLYVIWICNQN